MSDLLQQLSSFLNLSKLVAVTLPGMVATIALLLFLNPSPCKTDPANCWYCQGEQQKGSTTTPAAGAATRPAGTYFVSKLTWEQANQSYRDLSTAAPSSGLNVCGQLPEYIVSQSRLKTTKETAKNLGDLEVADVGTLLGELEKCNAALIAAQTDVTKREAAEANKLTTANAALTSLSSSQTTAITNANPTVAAGLEDQVARAKLRVAHELQLDSVLKAAMTSAAALIAQVATSKSSITTDVSTLIPVDTPPAKTTWQAAAQAIASNVLLFLLVAIVVGQVLDPVQRVMTSLDPIRGLTFPFLNRLYTSERTSGGIRFGDMRYGGTRSPYVDDLIRRRPHILEPSWAIGNGLLTEAEYSSLQDKYYSQSQITTGMMLPCLLLATAIYIRLLCCGVVEFHSSILLWVVGWLTFLLALAGVLVFCLVRQDKKEDRKGERERLKGQWKDLQGRLRILGEPAEETKQRKLEEDLERRRKVLALEANQRRIARQLEQLDDNQGWKVIVFFLSPLAALGLLVAGLWTAHASLENWWLACLAIGLPWIEVICFFAGIDRLHNFYSEVQARIVGSAQKQEDSQIQKFADVLTDPNPRKAFISELRKRGLEIITLLRNLRGGGE